MSECSFAEIEALLARGGTNVQSDSRQIGAGDVFLAVPGETEDGARYIDAAIAQGARYVLLTPEAMRARGETKAEVTFCPCEDMREAVWKLARARFGTDALSLKLVGITGTNGKTTSTYLLEHLFTALGERVGVLGTVSYRYPGFEEKAPLTTPDPLSIHRLLSQMQQAGCGVCIMEVSSHALAQQRVNGLPFAGAAFTNLTQDHLDFHQDMESYFREKSRLFTELPRKNKVMAIQSDDPYGERLLSLCPQALGFGLTKKEGFRQLSAKILRQDTRGLALEMELEGKKWELTSPLIGAFNAENLLCVQAMALEFGLTISDLSKLSGFAGVKGRLERIPTPNGEHVFVDYAHTPDALINVLKALRAAGFKRIITVFGCGGNRDRKKRPLMGEAVARLSDVAVVTSDNPRFEEPKAIISDILPGLACAREVHVESDRKTATALALSMLADEDDCVLIAGKGHEDYQIIKGVRNHYSDQEIVQEFFSASRHG